MTDNPYQSPQCQPEATLVEPLLRKRARFWFRASALVLFLPAVYNYWAFDTRQISRLPDDLMKLCRTVNILGLVVSAAVIWFLGLRTLEAVAQFVRIVLVSRIDRTAWEEVLHQSIPRMIYLAVPGATLWAIWVFGFYQAHADVRMLSWAMGVPAHLLAACWYAPLAYRWFRLALTSATSRTAC